MTTHPIPAELVQVADWLSSAQRAIAFTGAGISTESGVPDFRSPGGVWATNQPVYYQDFLASAEARSEYWRQKAISHRDFSAAQPNAGHRALAAWEARGRLRAVITQNIDGLHQLAGSQRVLELHGTARFVGCLECGERFDADAYVQRFLAEGRPPDCPSCGGLLKHATISFGQMLPPDVMQDALQLARQADLCLVVGSSLVVEPAASIPRTAKQRGSRLVIINREPSPQDELADAVLRGNCGEILTQLGR